MIKIGRSYIVHRGNKAHLCADVEINGKKQSLWYGVNITQEKYLSLGRADAFVVLLLSYAMRGGHEIVCEDPMSEKLHYQLLHNLMPSFVKAGKIYYDIPITANLTAKCYPNLGAVGTGFCGDLDSLFTVMTHGGDCEYPLTHLAVFNLEKFEGDRFRGNYRRNCDRTESFAKEQYLKTVFLDTNFYKALPEDFLEVYSFGIISCALAMQGLFSVYLLSCENDISQFCMDLSKPEKFDLLTVSSMTTESLCFYLSGMQTNKMGKLAALSERVPSYYIL